MQARIHYCTRAWLAGVALIVGAGAAGAQQGAIADRVAAAPADASVAMSFPTRAGVCGDGRSYISVGRSTISGDGYYDGRELSRGPCEPGPVRVVVNGTAADVELPAGFSTQPIPLPAGVLHEGTNDVDVRCPATPPTGCLAVEVLTFTYRAN